MSERDMSAWIYTPALAKVFDEFALRHPGDSELLLRLERSIALARLDAKPTGGANKWKWPENGWGEWVSEMADAFDEFPSQVWRQALFGVRGHKEAWLQVASASDDVNNTAIGAWPGVIKPKRMAKLGWTVDEDLPEVWVHDYTMTYAVGAFDRMAQVAHLVLGLQPSDLKIKKFGVG